MALARDRGLEDNKRHMVATFEQAVRLMPPHVEAWVWFSDFHGFGLRDMSPSIGSAFLGAHTRALPSLLDRSLARPQYMSDLRLSGCRMFMCFPQYLGKLRMRMVTDLHRASYM